MLNVEMTNIKNLDLYGKFKIFFFNKFELIKNSNEKFRVQG